MLLHDLILDRVKTHGSKTALVKSNEILDYESLADQINAVANGFSAIGLCAGDRVAIYLNKRIESVLGYFATSLAGGVFVPVNPVLKAAQVQHILNDCGVTILVTTAAQAKELTTVLKECKALRNLVIVDTAPAEPNELHVNVTDWLQMQSQDNRSQKLQRRIDNDIVSILYTSGSTGKPKGVVLSHRNMVDGAISVSSYLENVADDVVLAALPFSFDAGFSQMTTAFVSGASVVLLDYLLPRDVPRAISRYSVTGLTGVPPLWNQLAKVDWPAAAVASVRYIANTGGAMPSATLDKLRAKLPRTKVFLMYGLTEAFRSTYLPPEEVDHRPTSIGKAIPNAEVMVVREDGSLCDAGEPGELVHRGALVALGYWNDPDRTATRFKPAPGRIDALPFDEIAVWSGDRVVKDKEGFLYFVGRSDDMIKSSGYRISPTEIEESIYASELVTECAALGILHPELGQAIVIVAQSSTPDEETADMLITFCRRTLPNYMVPYKVVWKDTLPKNLNGKIDRKLLTDEYKHMYRDSE